MIVSEAAFHQFFQSKAPAPPEVDLSHEELVAHGHRFGKLLPLPALKKFEGLVALRDRLHAPVRSFSERISEIGAQIDRQQLQHSREEDAERRIATKEQRAASEEQRRITLASMRAQQDELRKQIDEITAEKAGLSGIVGSIETYVKERMTAPPGMHPGTKPPTGDPLRAIAAAKATISDLKTERAAIDAAPWPSAIVKAKALAEINDAAARGRPDCFRAIEENRPIRWPTIISGGERATDSFALTAWMFHDRLAEMTLREIDARSDDGAALDQQQRDARHADVARRLLAAERILEAAIEAAGPSGVRHRTRDQDPRAVLGLADDAPAPKVR